RHRAHQAHLRAAIDERRATECDGAAERDRRVLIIRPESGARTAENADLHDALSSDSAARMRAQERMPPWKLERSYFSFGEWMRSFSCAKPTISASRPSTSLKSPATGIEPPEPTVTQSLPHSS